MKFSEISFQIFLFVCTILCTFFCLLILLYLRRKPQTYTTLLDKFIEDIVKIFWWFSFIGNFYVYFAVFPHPFNEKLLFVSTGMLTFTVIGLFLWFNMIITLKYFLIFHPWVIPDSTFTDKEIWKMARIFSLFINVIISTLTMANYENHPIFRNLAGLPSDETTNFFNGPIYVLVTSLILLILYKIKLKNSQLQFQRDDTVKKFNLLIKIAVVISVMIMVLEKMLFRNSEISFVFKVQLYGFFGVVKTTLPLLFIYNHTNLRLFCLNVISYIFHA